MSASYYTPARLVLSYTSVYAFAELPGVQVCHADYALGHTVLCNALSCISIALYFAIYNHVVSLQFISYSED